MPDLALAVLPVTQIPAPREIETSGLADIAAEQIIEGLTQKLVQQPRSKCAAAKYMKPLEFGGKDYPEALAKMNKFFLQNCWSDGFPLVAPTEEAVNEMIQGTELLREHVVGFVEPGHGKATVEKIAINAVMAGCLPQYLPVIIAAVEAITDPLFYLSGVQCTTGNVSPLLFISGQKLIKELNINYSFGALGPGWRANTTIGRAIRLIMINLGHAWPGNPDMKPLGSVFKYVMLIAENEDACSDVWEPFRVAEGFSQDDSTISVMPAVSWQPDATDVAHEPATIKTVIEITAKQAKVKYDKHAENWGRHNLLLISPAAFEVIRKEGFSRANLQKALYESIQLPGFEFFEGKEPRNRVGAAATEIPEWIVNKCKSDPAALVPLLKNPESLKICVTGGPSTPMIAYVGTWGYGPAYFVTKSIKLPSNWKGLLEKYEGWDTPIP